MRYSLIEHSPEGRPPKEFTLTEMRVLYLKGVLPWDVYQHVEKAMTVQFSDYRSAIQKEELDLLKE